ncbi:MAG: metallophosphoesterase [Syntrophales bacterium]|nr:metallophosphoesterase [Syntrophales bacterium]
MRALHLGDLHVHLTGQRAAECRRVLDHIALNAAETKPDVILIAGDIYDRRSSPEERLYLAEFLIHLAAVAPVFAINGNHDDIDDVRLFRAEYGWNKDIEIITEPCVRHLVNGSLAFLPWPNLANLAAAAGAGTSIALRREAAKAALLDIVRGFRAELKPGTPSILIAHMPVTGASMDSGQPVSGGDEIALSADELLEGGAAGVALGHIHLRQQIKSLDGRPVFFSGAPFRCNFGESKGMKGGLIWDWNGKSWDVTPWDVPARKMILIEGKWADGDVYIEDYEDWSDFKDAEIRLRVEFPTDDRDAVRRAAGLKKDFLESQGAISVTIDERPIAVSRTRCAEITAARTTADKLLAWAKAADLTVPDGSIVKLSTLEMEVRS